MALDPLTAAFEIGGKLLDHFFPDPKQKAEAMLELEKLRANGDLAVITGQAKINEIEAASPNLFIAGWRPAAGWLCVAGMFMQFVVYPVVAWANTLTGHVVSLPSLDTGTLTTLLIGMLGLSGMRSLEKLNGVQGNH